jgi:hypothetical protein
MLAKHMNPVDVSIQSQLRGGHNRARSNVGECGPGRGAWLRTEVKLQMRSLTPLLPGSNLQPQAATRSLQKPSSILKVTFPKGATTIFHTLLTMRWLFSFLLLWLPVAISALSSSGNRVLVVLEDTAAKDKYSQFWSDLECR